MKFKRILAVLLSALMTVSMASFTVSANDAELMGEPVLSFISVSNFGPLGQNERAIVTKGLYDAENDIVYHRVTPNFDSTGSDDQIYINMYGLSGTPVTSEILYAVCYMRSNQATTTAHAGFYGNIHKYSPKQSYAGNEQWTKQIFPIDVADKVGTGTITHFWIRPIGETQVNGGVPGNKIMAENAYYDVAGVALFGNLADAEAYDIPALSSGKITISFDANGGEGELDSYDVVAGKFVPSNVVFPEDITAPEGMELVGWTTEINGTVLSGDVPTPDVDTTYYASYRYADDEDVEYDDIYLQNVYYKLVNEKNLTIGYLGGSVTVGAGATVSGPNSQTAWRALTTQWFKENFPAATIKEVYAGIGGTGSRFASYRMTRDLNLANNKIDLLFVDCCVNDSYEGFASADKEDLKGNDAVIVAKILENNPKCQIVFVNVTDSGKVKIEADVAPTAIHREFADENGFEFIDFKVAMARELMGNDEALAATDAAVSEKWSTYYTDGVHPKDAGYKVYFEYLRDELLYTLVDDSLTLSKATYEDTIPAALDLDTVDTDRYCGGAVGSNDLKGLSTIKNYMEGQLNGFMGGNSISATAEGYSTTFKFTGTNALIWGNKQSRNALLDVYLDDNTNIGSPDYTIDMWRNQDMSQSFMFPVLAEDLDEAREVQVTLVLRKNVDQDTRIAQVGSNAATVGERMSNAINNISIKGGTMDSVEFLDSPEAFKTAVTYGDVVITGMKGLGLKITGSGTVGAVNFTECEYDGKSVIAAKYNGNGESGLLATDGYQIGSFGNVVGEYYNYATIYMYVDDPENKTEGMKPTILIRESDDFKYGNNTFTADVGIVPNAWQRISIDVSNMENDNPNPFDGVNQYHMRYLGESGVAKNYPNVTIYAEKLVFSAEDPGDWADLDARVTAIKVNGELINGFNINTKDYTVELPFGTTEVPEVTFDKNIDEATVVVKQATSLDDTATVTLKGATEAEDIVYTISFTVFDGIRLNKVTAGNKEITLDNGKYEYTISLPAGTTEVPEIDVEFDGDPAKITVAQADSLEDTATITLNDGEEVVYTFNFYVLPSLEEMYPGAEIVYVSQAGAGEKTGATVDDAFAGIMDALKAKADNQQKTVFALVDTVKIVKNEWMTFPLDTVITAAGGCLELTSNPTFYPNRNGKVLFENLEIRHTNSKGDDGEVYLDSKGNDMIFKNVVATPFGGTRSADLIIQPGGDGGNFTRTDNVKFEVYDTVNVAIRGGGWGGTTFAGGIDYVIGGNSVVSSINLAGHAVKPDLPAADRTVKGNVTVTIKDNATIKSINSGNSAIINGDLTYNISDSAMIHKLTLGAGNSNGDVKGDIIVNINGGTVNEIAKGNIATDNKRIIVVNENEADAPATIDGATNVVTFEGDGTATVSVDEGTATVALESETAQWVEITDANGTKKYDMVTDAEVTLAHDMTYELEAGNTAIVFNAGTGVTFEAYEADGAKEDISYTVYGLDGMPVPEPEDIEVKNEHFEFVGWALKSDPEKTIVTDFYTFTPNEATYIAIFKEAPCAQFIAYKANGATADYNKTIYGNTGNPVSDKMAAEGIEAPAAMEHYTLLGWALEGTTEIVSAFGTFADEKAVYVAVYEEDPKFTITVMDGNDKVDEVTDYTGFEYTLPKLDHTPTTRFVGYALTAGATEAEYFAFEELEITVDVTFYAVRKEIVLEDAEYTFYGEYDFSEEQYIVEMYYVGPKANMTAFGLAYPEAFTVEYTDEFQSTGTHAIDEEGYYADVVYPTVGGTFGDDMKTPVLVATITLPMTAEEYADGAYEDLVKYDSTENITGAYAGGEWQYIKNSEDFSLDIAANVYPIYFTALEDDKDIEITVDGVDADISTVDVPTEGLMLEEIIFTVETAEGEEPGLVSYYVDGIGMGDLTAGGDGITYTIPAENVLGDVVIELSYGEPILEVAITGIDAPVAQKTPDTTAKTDGENFTIDSVEWDVDGEKFGFDTEYTVSVYVTADDGYAFSGKTEYTINGNTATATKVDKDTVKVSFTFEPTVKELGTVSVTAALIRDKNDAAYANFGTISVIDAEGKVVASATEGTEAGKTFAAELEVVAGTYTVEIAKNGYLTYTAEIEVAYKRTTTVTATLIAGNLYEEGQDDGVIDLLDFARVTKAFTAETNIEDANELAAYRATVDIDEDGIVTVFDLAYVKANFGTEAE